MLLLLLVCITALIFFWVLDSILLLFQAMGEVAFPRAVRDTSFLMNLQGVKLQSNSSRRSSNLFMNCCYFDAMGLSSISKSIDYLTAIAMTSILHTKLK